MTADETRIRNAALEEAAKVADKRTVPPDDCERGHTEWDTNAFVCSARECLSDVRAEEAEFLAAAIRALKTPEPAEPVADADGWIPWAGGPCPVPASTPVDVKCANGRYAYDHAAGLWAAEPHNLWEHKNADSGTNITAYRLSRNTETTR